MRTVSSTRCLSKCLGSRKSAALPCFSSLVSCSLVQIGLSSQLRVLSQAGEHLGIISLFLQFSREAHSPSPDRPIYLSLLKAASEVSYHPLVLSLHVRIWKSGYRNDVAVATALLDALCKCSDVDSAHKVFDDMPERDIPAWNAMLSGYARNGCIRKAGLLFAEMGSGILRPNAFTLSIMLKVCSGSDDERIGRSVHGHLVRHLELKDTFLENSLLVYYINAGDFCIAERIFEWMVKRDIMSWNAIMTGYSHCGSGWRALECFNLLREQGFVPDLVTLQIALQACAHIGAHAVDFGRGVHGFLVKAGYPLHIYAENNVLLMYCKGRMIDSGHSYFDRMNMRNAVSWNILIDGYIRIKRPEISLELVKSSRIEAGVDADILVSVLQVARIWTYCLKDVMGIHGIVVVSGFYSDLYITSSLISAYGDCGKPEFAHEVLDHFLSGSNKASVCWNAMLSAYVHNFYFTEALGLLRCMHDHACKIDNATLVNVLSLCTQQLNLRLGKAVHGYIIRNRLECDAIVTTAMVETYANCRSLREACYLFLNIQTRNIVTWNTILHGCLQNGFPRTSLMLFQLMQQQDGILPDATSLVGVIEAIAQRGHDRERNYIHNYAIERGLADNEFVVNALIAMHAGFHDFYKANSVFDQASKQSTITWNTMISEYCNCGLLEKAIAIFHLMKLNNVAPDAVTSLCLLRTCTSLGSLSFIMWIHAYVTKQGYDSDMFVGASLLNGYAKCGDLKIARRIFDRLKNKSTITWNSMIQGYGIHGNLEEVHKLFSQMQEDGLEPTIITFLNAISSCSHVGDIEMGKNYFDMMMHSYSFNPTSELFSTLADLIGRNGLIDEAFQALHRVPTEMGMHAWGALLGSCRNQSNYEVGVLAARNLLKFDPSCYNYHLLMSNMYAEAGNWMAAYRTRENVEKFKLARVSGRSIVEGFL